jgi:signal transduction histidine kinase
VDTTDEPPASWEPSSPDAKRPARWLQFRVTDSGIGLCAENLERIFQPFVQAEQSTVRQYGGTGLGLTVRSGDMRYAVF